MRIGVISKKEGYWSTRRILKAIAVRASRAVGLEISGVDMIMSGDGPYVLEVNASPGFRGLLDAAGVDASRGIVEVAIENAKAGV